MAEREGEREAYMGGSREPAARRARDVESLIALFRSDRIEERREAEEALVGKGQEAIPPLLEALRTPATPETRWYISRVLSRIGAPAVEPLLGVLRAGGDEEICRYAAAALAEMKDPPVGHFIRMLGDPEPRMRRYASLILCRIGRPAVEALKEALLDPDEMRQRCARMTLMRLGAGEAPGEGA